MLEGLIKQDVKSPLPIEYFVTYNMPIYKGIQLVCTLEKGTVVHDVTEVRDKSGWFCGYNFIVKDTGVPGHTNYAWALAENTPENRKYFRECEIMRKQAEAAQATFERHLRELKTLANNS